MNNIQVLLLSGDAALSPYAKTITATVNTAIKMVSKYIPVANVDILIANSDYNLGKKTMKGQAVTDNLIIVTINCKAKNILAALKADLPKLLAHKLYHVARSQNTAHSKTLLDECIEEGLAYCFETEVFGGKPSADSVAVKGKELQRIMQKAKKEFQSTDFDYDAWFYGAHQKKIPLFAGYAIGYKLVTRYLRTNQTVKPSQLVKVHPKKLSLSIGG